MTVKPHYHMAADGNVTKVHDGLVNLVSGLGTSRDKGGQAAYTMPTMIPAQALTAYKASALVRRIVDMPAEDACRQWREWQAEAVDISAIEAEENRLDLQGKTLEAKRQARAFGGCALLIGTGDADPSKPLIPERMKKGGIKYLTVLGRDDLTVQDFQRDPTQPDYGQPTFWVDNSQNLIHPSRVVVHQGIKSFQGMSYETGDGWGESELMGSLERIMAVDEVAGNVLSLVYEGKVDVIKVPDLMANLQQRGTDYSAEVIRRMTLAATAKGMNATLILDALEEYQQKSASFSGLPDIMDRMMQLTSAATGIPMVLLFGMSAGGLNASGDVDIRSYYDRVKVQQSLAMQPAMGVLDEALIYSALGSRPADVHYEWRSLWQQTAKEKAETGKLIADTHKAAVDMNALPLEVIGQSLVNALTESGAAPGLEGYAADFYEENGTDTGEIDDPAEIGALIDYIRPEPASLADKKVEELLDGIKRGMVRE